MGCYLMEQVIASKTTQWKGVTLIHDLRGVGLGTLASMGPTDARRGVAMWQEAFPCKLRRIFVISPGPFCGFFIEMVKSLASEKIQKRVTVLDPADLTPLQSEVGLEALPTEFGGTLDAGAYWSTWCQGRLRR